MCIFAIKMLRVHNQNVYFKIKNVAIVNQTAYCSHPKRWFGNLNFSIFCSKTFYMLIQMSIIAIKPRCDLQSERVLLRSQTLHLAIRMCIFDIAKNSFDNQNGVLSFKNIAFDNQNALQLTIRMRCV